MGLYYYYDQLCEAINSSLRITRKVTDTYGKIICLVADQRHIYLQPRTQQGGDRDIDYYWMMQEDI